MPRRKASAPGRGAMIGLGGENYREGEEASRLLGVKISTVYAHVSRGILKSDKQGIKRQRLYKQVELEGLLRLRPSSSPLSPEETEPKRRVEIPLAEDWVPYT